MDNSARTVGYAAVGLALAAVMALLVFWRLQSAAGPELVRVRFPVVGTLMEEDPVKRRGVEVGRVRRIELHGHAAVASLEFYRRDFIPRDSRFVNFNYSLMGGRMVVLVPGESAAPLDPSRVQQGLYSEGVAELIHKVDELLGLVEALAAAAGSWDTGTAASPSFQARLDSQIGPYARRWTTFAREFGDLEMELTGNIEALSLLTRDLAAGVPRLREGTRQGMEKAVRAVSALDTLTSMTLPLLQKTQNLLDRVRDSTSAAHKLLTGPEAHAAMVEFSRRLRRVMELLREEGARELLHRHNLHFFRRSKQTTR